ncbi:MAG: polymer-forming cytoskeletal protein [Acidobacteriota bacterium]
MKAARPVTLTGFLGEGMEIQGTVRFHNLLRVDGLLRGRVESYDTLIVGRSGRVEAEVIVGTLQVYGSVKGKIAVDEKVEIFAGGRVEGELYAPAPAVEITPGGRFEGQLHEMPGREEKDETGENGPPRRVTQGP